MVNATFDSWKSGTFAALSPISGTFLSQRPRAHGLFSVRAWLWLVVAIKAKSSAIASQENRIKTFMAKSWDILTHVPWVTDVPSIRSQLLGINLWNKHLPGCESSHEQAVLLREKVEFSNSVIISTWVAHSVPRTRLPLSGARWSIKTFERTAKEQREKLSCCFSVSDS